MGLPVASGDDRVTVLRFAAVNLALASVIGRPRTVLDIGGHVSSLALRRRSGLNDVITTPVNEQAVAQAVGNRRFDLVVSDGSLLGSSPVPAIEQLARYMDEEAHLILVLRKEAHPEKELPRWIGDAGLQFLRIEHAPALGDEILPEKVGMAIAKVAPRKNEYVLVARKRPSPGPLSLTVGMLTMNEEQSVARLIEEIRKVAPDASILCVDSSTKDQTHVIAEKMGARVIRQLPPRGHGPAMEVLMYEAAAQSDALIYLDCDFTYPPSYIPTLRSILESGVDMVNAARTRHRPKAMPLPNFLANRTFALCAHMLHGVPTTDLHSGMRAYRSSLTRAFNFDGEGDAIPIDTLLWPIRCGYDVVEMAIDYAEREGESKLRKIAGTTWTFIRLAKTLSVGSRRTDGYRVE